MLNDRHMNAAQSMLKQQFPQVSGLQDVLLAQSKYLPMPPQSAACVHIHHTRGNHWVVSSCDSATQAVYVYDSIYNAIAPDLQTQIEQIYPAMATNVIFPVVHQVGGVACGLFAVATSLELCRSNGQNPCIHQFDQPQMRGHFLKCLLNGVLTPFP